MWIVVNFLVLWSICLTSSLVHFKNDEYFTRGTSQMFISLMRFLLQSLISRSFLFLPKYSFLMFSYISACLMVSTSNILEYLLLLYFLRVFFFFSPALANSPSLVSKWQQVISNLQYPSQYFGRSWLCRNLNSLVSNSFRPFSKHLRTVLSAPITTGITATLMFKNVLVLWQVSNICLSFLFLWFFTLWSAETAKSTIQ